MTGKSNMIDLRANKWRRLQNGSRLCCLFEHILHERCVIIRVRQQVVTRSIPGGFMVQVIRLRLKTAVKRDKN